MDIIEKTDLELAFEAFNNLMDDYNNSITATDNVEEQEKIQAEFDILINEEEQKLEAAVEKDFQDNELALAQEEKLIFKELEDLEKENIEENSPIEKEIQFLKDNELTVVDITKRYNKANNNKNGFSTTEIYKYLNGEGNPTELEMAEHIFKLINSAK